MKKCSVCKKNKNKDLFHKNPRMKDGLFSSCKDCCNSRSREAHKKAYKLDPEKYRKRSTDWIKNNRKIAEIMWRRSGKKYREKQRMMALKKYGDKCACCGEKEYKFLSFDHINGGGNKHRKIVGVKTVKYIIKNNFPAIFQILCHNCNLAKGFYGKCPHDEVV